MTGSPDSAADSRETERGALALIEEAFELPPSDQSGFIEGRLDKPEMVRALALAMLASDRGGRGISASGLDGVSHLQGSSAAPIVFGLRILP